MTRVFSTILSSLAVLFAGAAFGYDHTYKAWDDLLKSHVTYIQDGNASRVNYTAFARDRDKLRAVLDDFSKVERKEFNTWTKPQQQAFLINAYNAYTVEKILTRYPNLKSIRDFGSVFGNPWKDKFFMLFGESFYLDRIEHEMLRAEGVYDEPRVHVAVVCASIGCPMLRNEPFTADKLDAQLEDAMRRFMSDRTRNRYNAAARKLEVSKIFDWYGKDFEKGHKGFASVRQTMSRYADQLADKPEDRAVVRDQKADLAFLDYDWSLNDVK